MLRASIGTTLALLGALGALAAGSLTAHASPAVEPPVDTFTVVSAATSPDGLNVVVDSVSAVTGLTAQFLADGTDSYNQVLTLQSTETDPSDANQTQTTWTATNIPAGTSGLPLGSYTVNLNATYSDSTTSTVADAGTFAFLAQPTVTLTASDTSLTYGHASTALTGTVGLVNPDGTPNSDYTGLSVNLIAESQVGDTIAESQVADALPVSSTGTFSDPDFTPSASESVIAEVIGYGVDSSESAPVKLTVTNTTPTLSLKVNPVTETYGKPVTVTGTLKHTAGSTSAPLAGQKVWVNTTKSSANALATATSTDNGSFSITLPRRASGGTLYVGSISATDLSAVVVPLTLRVVHPTGISNVKVSLSQYQALSVSGCLGFPSSDTTERIDHTSGLTVQYSASTKGPWKNLFKISGSESDTPCGTGGIKFSGSFGAPGNYAFYRVVYAGTTGATSYAATDSDAVLAWRYADRITDFKVSPTVVNAGGKLTVKGTLQYYYKTWHDYSGQTIWIELHPKGSSSTWYWMVKVKTNSKGQFSATFKDPISATWDALFEGNNSNGVGHLAVLSPGVYVRLK